MQIQPQIESAIEAAFSIDYMTLINESHNHSGSATESHFKLTLVSRDFIELSRVKRQQAVYRVLKELMPQFHALALHTYTPDEWASLDQTSPSSPRCGGGKGN